MLCIYKSGGALALIAGLLLAACGAGGGGSRAITLMLWGDPAEVRAYEELVAAFEAGHPEIEVQLVAIPGSAEYNQRLAAQFAAGKPPDLLLLNYRRYPLFAAAGQLQTLGPYVEASDQVAAGDFYPQAIEAFSLDGQLWCLPQNISSLVVYYNHDLFAAAGLPDPAPGWTTEDFLQAARRLTRDLDGDGQVDQYGAGIQPSLVRLAPFIWQAGGEIVDDPRHPTRLALDGPAALAAFQWFVNLQTVEHVAPGRSAESAESSESRFLNGRLGMLFNSRRGVPTYRTITAFAWNVAPLPRATSAANILHSDAYCMAAESTNKEAAWKFIEYANSLPGQTLIAGSGRTVPSRMAVAESPAFLDPLQPPAASQVFLAVIPDLRRLPLLSTWPGIEEIASREIERAFYGEISAAEAAAQAAALTQALFEQAIPIP